MWPCLQPLQLGGGDARARPTNRRGFPSSGYWADAADSVSVRPGSGNSAAVEPKAAGPDADDGPPRTLGGGLW